MPTAAAKRAAEADKEREKRNEYQRRYRERHATELREKHKEKARRKKAAEVEELAVATPYPADATIAAALNQAHEIAVIEAEAHHRNKHVIVENISIDGMPCHRVKTTVYSYHYTQSW